MDATLRSPIAAMEGEKTRRSCWVATALVFAFLVIAYAQEVGDLVATWAGDDDYSHGFLVVPVAVTILCVRWPGLSRAVTRPSWWGWALVVAALIVRSYWHESGRPLLEQFTLLPVVFGLALGLGGWGLMRWAWPGLAYLAFMFPLPPKVNQVLSMPLQRLATTCTIELVRLTGLWATSEGNIIYINNNHL